MSGLLQLLVTRGLVASGAYSFSVQETLNPKP